MKKYKRILCISDLHIPYHHFDCFKFLSAVKKKYKPDKIVQSGDECDFHAISMHDHSPDLLSPHSELEIAKSAMKILYKLFPQMDLLESNHGSLVYRRASKYGLPSSVIKTYNEILDAPNGWKWHSDLVLYASDGNPIYFCHGQSSDVLRNSKNRSMNYVQGHHHSKLEIRYWANSLNLYWGVTTGCLIDYKALAFEYGRIMLDKPILGVTMILDGHPKLVPMILNKNGRWNGVVP